MLGERRDSAAVGRSVQRAEARPQGVLFDFGGTLAVLSPTREELFLEAAACVGIDVDPTAVRMAYRIVEFHRPYSSVRITDDAERARFYDEYNGMLCDALGLSNYRDVLTPALAGAFTAGRAWVPAVGAQEALERLAELGIPFGIVSNWDRVLPDLVAKMGFRIAAAAIVSSQAAGTEKPDPVLFHLGLDAIGMERAQGESVTYVGDDYRLDVLGARAAGLSPVLIDPEERYPSPDCPRFRTLAEWSGTLI